MQQFEFGRRQFDGFASQRDLMLVDINNEIANLQDALPDRVFPYRAP
jgi:hypothetical protein